MLKLKWAISPICIIGHPKNFSNSSSLKLKERRRDPIYLTEVLETGNGISIISENGVISRKPTSTNPKNSTPVFCNRLIPHYVASRWANGRAKVGVCAEDFEVGPLGNMFGEPLLNFPFGFLKILWGRRDDDTLFDVEG